MAKTLGGAIYGFMGSMTDQYTVFVNNNHKIVDKILKADDEEAQGNLAKQAFDLALLSQGLLPGADLTNFIKRSVDLVA